MKRWLEISSCSGEPQTVLSPSAVQEIPALASALKEVQGVNAPGRAALWEYAVKVSEEEFEKMRSLAGFAVNEDERAVVLSAEVSFGGACYALRLFVDKSQ